MKVGDKIRIQKIVVTDSPKDKKTKVKGKELQKEGNIIGIYPYFLLVQFGVHKEGVNFKDVFFPHDLLVQFRVENEWVQLEATEKKSFKELGWC